MKALRNIHWRKTSEHQEGFTLVELLVVIVILGILAAIVVFAVTGITGKGQTNACNTDAKTVQSAEEAANANSPSSSYGGTAYTGYVPGSILVSEGLLHSASNLWSVTGATGTSNTAYGLTAIANNPDNCSGTA